MLRIHHFTILHQERPLGIDEAPSWLYEVEHGATTIWESWFAMDEDGEPFVSQMGEYTFTMSLNHYAFGCVDDWMFRSITGIDSIGPGFKRIRIAPRFRPKDPGAFFAGKTAPT